MKEISWDKPLLEGGGVAALIPQRDPIVLVDRFYGMDKDGSYTALKIEPSTLFCRDGRFDECGLTEHIAQSAAVRVGYLYRRKGEKIPTGFIGSVDKMKYYALPCVGDDLHTCVRVIQEVFDITLISAEVWVGEKRIADGRLKIFLKKEEA